jgi:hypothetical protein
MMVNINVRVTSFGQVVFEGGKPTTPIEVTSVIPAHEEVRYREPLETASRIYEVQYQEEPMNYVVPPSTA